MMMGRIVQFRLAIGAACLALSGTAVPVAYAQCRLCSAPSTKKADTDSGKPIELQVETRLDFDRLVVVGPGSGTAMLLPNGERGVAGSVGALSGRAMVGAVSVRGEPGRAVVVEIPRRIELFSLSGGRITVDNMTTDLPSMPRLDSAGTLEFRFGGKLQLMGDADGDFRGDVPITVDYL